MAHSINKIILIGNVGKTPEIRTTTNGSKFTCITLATGEFRVDKTTNKCQDITEWHRIVIYNERLVDIVEKFVNKGTKLYVEGNLQTRTWVDRETNVNRSITEVVLKGYNCSLVILDKKSYKDNDNETDAKDDNETDAEDDDEIPF